MTLNADDSDGPSLPSFLAGGQREVGTGKVTLPSGEYDLLVQAYLANFTYEAVLANMPGAVILFEPTGVGDFTIKYVNAAAWSLLQLNPLPGIALPRNLIGRTLLTVGYSEEYLENFTVDLEAALEREVPATREVTFGQVDNRRTLFSAIIPVYEIGQLKYVMQSFTDITDVKNAQEEKLKAELEVTRLQRLLTATIITSAIVHDANNLLGAAILNLQLSIEDILSGNYDVIDSLKGGLGLLRVVKELMNRIRHTTLVSRESMKVQDVYTIAQTVLGHHLSSLKTKLSSQYPVVNDLKVKLSASGNTSCMIDRISIQTTITNIVTNAIEAMLMRPQDTMDDSYTPQLTVSVDESEENIVIQISDNGVGISEQILAKIFDFEFTNKHGKNLVGGEGKGLYTVNEIVALHNGKIEVTSVVNEGTSFKITLPKIQPFLDSEV